MTIKQFFMYHILLQFNLNFKQLTSCEEKTMVVKREKNVIGVIHSCRTMKKITGGC